MQHSTIAAIATAPGAGGIAIVRLSGPESYEVAAKVFRPANPAKKVADAKGYTAMFGAFVEGEEAFDEGVVLFFRAPHSYTGEDVVELSCHGGSAVARRPMNTASSPTRTSSMPVTSSISWSIQIRPMPWAYCPRTMARSFPPLRQRGMPSA